MADSKLNFTDDYNASIRNMKVEQLICGKCIYYSESNYFCHSETGKMANCSKGYMRGKDMRDKSFKNKLFEGCMEGKNGVELWKAIVSRASSINNMKDDNIKILAVGVGKQFDKNKHIKEAMESIYEAEKVGHRWDKGSLRE
jgi:hypothetical protein